MLHQLPPAPAPVQVEVADQRGEFPESRCGGGGGPVRCTSATPARFDNVLTFVPPGASLTADAFFGDSPADRGSGRVYLVTIGRHQPFYSPETGRELYISFAVVHLKVPVVATFMGFGEQDQVVAYVAEHYPTWVVVESNAIAA
jgi:hypothetical protein